MVPAVTGPRVLLVARVQRELMVRPGLSVVLVVLVVRAVRPAQAARRVLVVRAVTVRPGVRAAPPVVMPVVSAWLVVPVVLEVPRVPVELPVPVPVAAARRATPALAVRVGQVVAVAQVLMPVRWP